MFRSAMHAGFVLVASLALVPLGTAQAAITIDELFSNFDGTIQFIMLTRYGDPLPSLAGRTLVAEDGKTTHAYTFPADVAADRNQPHILLATQAFANLGKVAPDFVVPNGFLPLAGGSVVLGDAVLDYTGTPLPSDGWHALYRDVFSGSVAAFVAATSNSRGDAYAFTRAPALTGLWWDAAAPGWGLATEQQGGVVFALWATQGADGSPTWFYVTADGAGCDEFDFECRKPIQATGFGGTLYTTTGPPWSSASYDASRVVTTEAGTLWFQLFAAPKDEGWLEYSLGGMSGQRTVSRAVFGDPVRQCFVTPLLAGLAPNGDGGSTNREGLWWNPSEPGWALQLNHQGDAIFAIWFTYDETGRATWLSFTAQRATGDRYAGALYRTSSVPAVCDTCGAGDDPPLPTAVNTAVGTASVAFTDGNHGTFTFEMSGIARTKAIEREQLAADPPICD